MKTLLDVACLGAIGALPEPRPPETEFAQMSEEAQQGVVALFFGESPTLSESARQEILTWGGR